MYLSSITEGGLTSALISSMSYNESRLKMISENVANIGTVGYRAKQLDTTSFQQSLRTAIDAKKTDPQEPFNVEVNGEVSTDQFGQLHVTPSRTPVENILFHDGTNMSIERQMADLAETGLMHETVATLLRGNFDGLRKAIRGRVG